MQPVPDPSTSVPNSRVLLVEDDPDLGRALRTALVEDRIELTQARHVAEALERVAQQSFELVLLDLGLPGAEGWEVLNFLRQPGLEQQVPVILLPPEIPRLTSCVGSIWARMIM